MNANGHHDAEPAPLVDEALRATQERRADTGPSASAEDQISALKAEVERLSESVNLIIGGSQNVLMSKIRERPLGALAVIGTIAYLFGRTR